MHDFIRSFSRLMRFDRIPAFLRAMADPRDLGPSLPGDRLFAEALSSSGHASGAG